MERAAMEAEVTEFLSSESPGELIDLVGYAEKHRVAVMTLANPDRANALNLAAWYRVAALADRVADSDARVVVIKGLGPKGFSAGADITEFPGKRMTASAALEYNEGVAAALRSLAGLDRPVVAMLRGLTVGGGCELAAACDLRICADDTRLGIPIGRLGVTLGYTETQTMVRLIGPSRLKLLLMTGELIAARDAYDFGLVDRVVPRASLEEATAAVVAAILESSSATIRAAKIVTNMATRDMTDTDTEILARIAVEVYSGPQLAEGVRAFVDRRPPQFPD